MQISVRNAAVSYSPMSDETRLRKVVQVTNQLVRMHQAAGQKDQTVGDISLPTEKDDTKSASFSFFADAVGQMMAAQNLLFGQLSPKLASASELAMEEFIPDWESLHLLFSEQLSIQVSFLAAVTKRARSSNTTVSPFQSATTKTRLSLIHSIIHLQLFMVTKEKFSPFYPAPPALGGSKSRDEEQEEEEYQNRGARLAATAIEQVQRYQHSLLEIRATPATTIPTRTLVMQMRLIIGKYWLYISEALPVAKDAVLGFFSSSDIRRVLGTNANLVRFGSAAFSRVCLQLIYRLRGGGNTGAKSNLHATATPPHDIQVGKVIADLLLRVFCRVSVQMPPELLDTLAPDAKQMLHAAQRSWAADFVAQLCTSIRGFVSDVLLIHGGAADPQQISVGGGHRSDFSLYALGRGWIHEAPTAGGRTSANMSPYKNTVVAARKEVLIQLDAISQVKISSLEAQKIGLRPHMIALTAGRTPPTPGSSAAAGQPTELKYFPEVESTLSPYHVIVMGALGFEPVKVAATLCHYSSGDTWAIADSPSSGSVDPEEQASHREERLATATAGVYMERFPLVDPSTTDLFNPPQLLDPSEEGQMLLSYLFSFLLLDEKTVEVLTTVPTTAGGARLEIVEVSSLYSTLFVHDLQSLQLSSMLERPTLMLGAVPGNADRTLQKMLTLLRCEEVFSRAGGAGDRETCLNLRLRFATRLAAALKVVMENYLAKGLRQYMVAYFVDTFRILLSTERVATDTTNPEQCLIQLETLSQLFQLFPLLQLKEIPNATEKARKLFTAQFLRAVQATATIAMERISEHRDILCRVMDQAFEISCKVPTPPWGGASLNAVLAPPEATRTDPTVVESERVGYMLFPYLVGMQSVVVFKHVTDEDPLPPEGGLVSSSGGAMMDKNNTQRGGFSLLIERWVPLTLKALQVKGLLASGAAHDALQLPIRESSPWLLHLMPTYLLAAAPETTVVSQDPSGTTVTPSGVRQLFFKGCKYGIPQRMVVQRFCTSIRAACQAAEAFHIPPAPVRGGDTNKKDTPPTDANLRSLVRHQAAAVTAVGARSSELDGVGMALLAAESVYNNVRFWNGRVFSQVKVAGDDAIKLIQERGKWYTAALINLLQCSDPRVLEQVCDYVEVVLAEVFHGMPKTESYWRKFIGFTVQRSKNSATKASLAHWLLTLDERLVMRKLKTRMGRSKL